MSPNTVLAEEKIITNIFTRKEQNFVLWRVAQTTPPPKLIIGQLKPGAPITFQNEQQFALRQATDFADLWEIPAAECNLTNGQVYHYWFEVTDAHRKRTGQRIRVTDPFAFSVDWRMLADKPSGAEYNDDDRYPAATVLFIDGRLVPCDASGERAVLNIEPSLDKLAPNNRIVIYEIPTAWSRKTSDGVLDIGVGTFRDVSALIDEDESGTNFSDLSVTQPGRAYLTELGINTIQLLPPADSIFNREWGYGTTNFFAPDFDLGYSQDYSFPVPNRDLSTLVDACHRSGIRFFIDVVMAFSRANPYLAVATDDFFILDPRSNPSDPDSHNSRGKDNNNFRDGFGSTLFRYAAFKKTYDPISGTQASLSPARQFMQACLLRWMNDFRIDGIRMDSVENVYNWDFIKEYKNQARNTWRQQFTAEPGKTEERFIVVGEELQEPLDLLNQQRLDGLWHENFKRYIRAALLGNKADGEPSFDWTVRKAIDCRYFGFTDGAKAVIYLTSHDVEGLRNERLFNFFRNNGVADAEKRIKLAFVCLLTAVGIPQILAGDEFADEHDLFDRNGNVAQSGGKQVESCEFLTVE